MEEVTRPRRCSPERASASSGLRVTDHDDTWSKSDLWGSERSCYAASIPKAFVSGKEVSSCVVKLVLKKQADISQNLGYCTDKAV